MKNNSNEQLRHYDNQVMYIKYEHVLYVLHRLILSLLVFSRCLVTNVQHRNNSRI